MNQFTETGALPCSARCGSHEFLAGIWENHDHLCQHSVGHEEEGREHRCRCGAAWTYSEENPAPIDALVAVIDAAHIEHQRAWSTETFGPAMMRGPHGPLAHLRKEVEEVAASPYDLEEWVDCIILALDGAWRAGHEPQQIVDAVKAKQAKNEARTWPDWRGVPADQAIEHVRNSPGQTAGDA